MMSSIKKIRLFPQHFLNQELTIKGWVRSNRKGKVVSFLVLSDGSTLETLQIVYHHQLSNFAELIKLLPGSAVVVVGTCTVSNKSKENIEIQASKITIINATKNDYFLQNKKHSKEFLRTKLELRPRSRLFQVIFAIRNTLSFAIHDFFFHEHFLYLHSPILTSNDCEGAGESFQIHNAHEFFKTNANLSVSGQLHAEALAQTYKKVYTFGPTFRADKSDTSFHTSEFWMIEPEVAFANNQDGMVLAENLIKSIVEKVYINHQKELHFLAESNKIDLLLRIEKLIKKPFVKITYTQAIACLQKNATYFRDPIVWGMDLKKEHEHFICQFWDHQPVFVTDYPYEIKAFYMKQNPDLKTVASFDLLFPGVGEVVGGSERENDYHKLLEHLKFKKIDAKQLQWYLDLRFQGYGGSTGFGLGLDRLLMYLTGMENIRDVIPFYRGFKTLNY